MSYNGSGTFQINTSGQPVVTGTSISSTVFNALTADLATGLSTAITKDGQTTTTARIPFALGINSTLVTDATNTTSGSIITAGGVGIAKALYVGTTANVAGAVTLGGVATFSAQPIFSSLTASSAVATDASKGLVSVTNTGTGNNVLATGPTISGPTISDGTANGVAYLNGSKVLTTGSALVFDGSNLGVGVTPSAWSSALRVFQFGANASIYGNGSNTAFFGLNFYTDSGATNRYLTSNIASAYGQNSGQHQWYTAASGTAGNAITFTQAMTLDASGNLLVGTTSATSGGATCKEVVYISNFATTTGISVQGGTNNAGTFFQTVNYAGTINGSITQTNASTVAYNTTSDYRLKENIQPMTGALAKVQALNPVVYKWKSDGSDGQGFIAHELQAVVPDCVVGEKDSVDANGNPKYQGIDTSFLVATLTAAIKEQSVLITTLTDRITALENK